MAVDLSKLPPSFYQSRPAPIGLTDPNVNDTGFALDTNRRQNTQSDPLEVLRQQQLLEQMKSDQWQGGGGIPAPTPGVQPSTGGAAMGFARIRPRR